MLEMPVAFAFGLGAITLVLISGQDLTYLAPYAFSQVNVFALLALPLFTATGVLMQSSGIANRLINFFDLAVGRMRGGLGAVTVVVSAFFGAIAGSGSSAIAAIGSIMIPKLVARGYDRGEAVALVGCSSVLSLLIPPSIPMIVFSITAGISISAVFLSTVVPGLILMSIYIVLNSMLTKRNVKIQQAVQLRESLEAAPRHIMTDAFPALLLPVIVLGGIYSGSFTPTEAAAIAVIYTLFAGFLTKPDFSVNIAANSISKGALAAGAIIIILFFMAVMNRAMILDQVPQSIASALIGVSENRFLILAVTNILLIVIGMLVDDVSGSVIAAVVLAPVMSEVGIHPVHFAAIVSVNLGLGNLTPPCAPLLYMAGQTGECQFRHYVRPTLRLLLFGHVPVVVLVTYIPELALTLPRLILGIS